MLLLFRTFQMRMIKNAPIKEASDEADIFSLCAPNVLNSKEILSVRKELNIDNIK